MTNGLPSNKVYSIKQDSKGYIWFATDFGVARFDGILWEKYSLKEGLSDIEVFQIHEDSRNRIWFVCGNGTLSYFKDGKIYSSGNSKFLADIKQESFHYAFKEYKGNVFFGGESSVIEIRSDNTVKRHKLKSESTESVSYLFGYEDDLYAIAGSYVHVFDNEREQFKRVFKHRSKVFSRACVVGKHLLIGFESKLYHYNLDNYQLADSITLEGGKKIQLITNNYKGDFLLGTNKGVYRYNRAKQITRPLFENYSISNVIYDHEGSIWISTLNGGSLFLRNTYTSVYYPEFRFEDFFQDEIDEGVYCGMENGRYADLKKIDSVVYRGITSTSLKSKVHYVWSDREEFLAFSNEGVLWNRNEEENYSKLPTREVQKKGDSIYFSRTSGLYLTDVETIKSFSTKDSTMTGLIRPEYVSNRIFQGDVTSFFVESFNRIWLGCSYGLFLKENGTVKELISNVRISSIREYEQMIIVCTLGQGIYIFKDAQCTYHADKSSGLISDFCNNSGGRTKSELWIATQEGVSVLNFKNEKAIVQSLSDRDGLPSGSINDIFFDSRDNIWLSSDHGIIHFSFPETKFPTSVKKTVIQFIENDGKKINPKNKVIDLDHGVKRLKVVLSGFSYRNSPEFAYRINGSDWSYSSNGVVSLLNLEPGRYKFEAYSTNGERVPNSTLTTLEIVIHPPFWQTIWFRILVGMLVLGLIYLFFRIKILVYNRDIVRDILLLFIRKLKRQHTILIKNSHDGTQVKLPINEIIRVEGAKDYVRVHLSEKRILTKNTMKNMIKQLNIKNQNFYRVHQSHVVNIDFIEAFHTDHLFVKGEKIPIGRAYKTEAKRLKQRYLIR